MTHYKYLSLKKNLFLLLLTSIITLHSFAQFIKNVKELNTTGTSNSYPFDFTVLDTKLFFIAAGNSGTYSLWVIDGTDASTTMISPSTGPLNNIRDIIAYNNKIYFAYDDGINGMELWVSDGTAGGTTLFKDLYPGSTGSYPEAFTVANNKLFFMGSSVDGERRLYVSDGTPAGTIVIRNNYIRLFNGLLDFAVVNNDIYFSSDNGTGFGYGLWKSNGSLAGTVLVKPDLIAGTSPGDYAAMNNKLYFSGFDYTNGSELWVSDGTEPGTYMVKNLSTDAGGTLYSGEPINLKVYNNKLYFAARDDTHGMELFVSDGTDPGTQLVKDILPGTDGSIPYVSTIYNGLLYFICYGTRELWKTDGTAAGTQLVKSLPDVAKFAATWNTKMYLILGSDYAVWQSDGTTAGTTPIQLQNTANPVYSLNNDFKFKEYNAALYLSASCNSITIGFEPSKLTLTALPLKLISFKGEEKDNKDILTWTTTNEINTSHFIIEQSKNGAFFTPIGKLEASGKNAGNKSYEYTQQTILNPGGFYRLKMVDKDAAFSYSSIIRLNRNRSGELTGIYNIVNKQIMIKNPASIECHWKLISQNGELIKQGAFSNSTLAIPVSGIAKGTHFLFLQSASQAKTVKLMIF